jgi:dipeptidyl aminopeptidase/acylaminoacyl peptidase
LQPNFRGSAGYGPKFRDAGFGEFGGKMVTDVIDGYDYLVKQGIAKPDGFCAIGWSYGGYSVLQIAAMVPQKTKCVVAIGAVTDPFALKRQISQSGDETATYYVQYLGEKDNPEFKPVAQVAKVTAPVLMVHGIYDKTVNFTQAKSYRSAMKDRAEDKFRLIEVEGEDHYFLDTPTRQMLLKESAAWLKKNYPL